MKINKDTSVFYIICPANYSTGGPLLLHQLAYKLISKGYKAMMYYYKTENCDLNNPVHENYKKFNIPYVLEVDDNSNNIIVIPEVFPEYIFDYKNIQRVIWWLSVDNFLLTHSKKPSFSLKRFLGLKEKRYYYNFKNKPKHYHWVQSTYAVNFLKKKKVKDAMYLSDYLDDVFLNDVKNLDFKNLNKQNNIVYNPSKGIEITQELINFAPNFNWIPIQNMTPAEVKNLLLTSKVYIDFGNHPGKDRIPREAAVSGCVVITNKKGSANYFEDVTIEELYKFEDVLSNKEKFVNLIDDVFLNFPDHSDKFEAYRKLLFNEESKFESDLDKILNS